MLLVARLAQLDEPCVLGEAAGVEIERDAVAPADGAYLARIFHRDWLAAAGVVGDREHDERNAAAAHALDEALECSHIHIAFEGVQHCGLAALGDRQIDSFSAGKLDVGTRGVEVSVVGNDVPFLTRDAEEDALSRAALVGGNDVPVTEDVLDGIPETVEAAAARVALIAFHDGGPLMGRHGAGAGIGEQVDEDIVGGQEKEIVVRGLQKFFALGASGPADGLNTLDAERLDDSSGDHEGSFEACGSGSASRTRRTMMVSSSKRSLLP